MGFFIEIVTNDGERHYAYDPSEDKIESLLACDAVEDLEINPDDVNVVAIADSPEALANG